MLYLIGSFIYYIVGMLFDVFITYISVKRFPYMIMYEQNPIARIYYQIYGPKGIFYSAVNKIKLIVNIGLIVITSLILMIFFEPLTSVKVALVVDGTISFLCFGINLLTFIKETFK